MKNHLDEATKVWLLMQTKPETVAAESVLAAVVDPGSFCNLRCPFCATGNSTIALSRGAMSLKDFKKALRRLPRISKLALYQWGEPLLHPQACKMIEAASKNGIAVSISTNLSLSDFDAAAARSLVRSGLSRLIVSCDGASQETYELYRVGGDFGLVMRNLKSVLAAVREAGAKVPKVVWQFLVHRGNQHEIKAASAAARKLGVPIVFEKLGVPSAQAARWSADPAALEALPKEKRRSPIRKWSREPDKWPSLCLQAWDMPVVHADGTVLPCCVVSDRRYGLGNLFKTPFETIWNGPLITAMRRYLRSGRREREGLPCYGCPHDPYSPERGQ